MFVLCTHALRRMCVYVVKCVGYEVERRERKRGREKESEREMCERQKQNLN